MRTLSRQYDVVQILECVRGDSHSTETLPVKCDGDLKGGSRGVKLEVDKEYIVSQCKGRNLRCQSSLKLVK